MPKRYVRELTIHRRHLPHWEMPGAVYFVTFNLKHPDTCDLSRDDIAPIILGALSHYANKRYYLCDHTVMPDHVHMILQPIVKDGKIEVLGDIVGGIKRYTAHRINELLARKGPLWLDESYDRIIRDKHEYDEKARYILENPVKVGLVKRGEDWKWWRPGIPPPSW
jgi:putative transposase